jgi:hypothetical protein
MRGDGIMEQVIERCCGLDVHRDTVVACVRVPGAKRGHQQHVRAFGTTTAELLTLRDRDPRTPPSLLHGDRLRRVPRLVDIVALERRQMIGEGVGLGSEAVPAAASCCFSSA